MKIDMMPISELRPYARNARIHSKRQIKQIGRSIERFGFCNPVLIDDNNEIIAGHGRVEAAKLLALKEVPTVRLAHLNESEKRAYVLADNRLAEKAGWDRQTLAIELQGLIDLGFEIELTGFDPADVDLMIEEIGDHDDRNGDAVPAYEKSRAVSETGDLWVLGNHRLLYEGAETARAEFFRPRGGEV
jgi:ParB-like chromosome segregation protein Spo0J